MSGTVYGYNVGFLLHIVIEIPAFINFLLFPSGQLGTPTPHAHAVVRQYAMLLLSSVLVSVAVLQRPQDTLTGQLSGALSIYHIGPSIRAASRLVQRADLGKKLLPSEAALYLFVHCICGAALFHGCWSFYLKSLLHP